MSRKPRSTDDDSQKENSGFSTKVKQEKLSSSSHGVVMQEKGKGKQVQVQEREEEPDEETNTEMDEDGEQNEMEDDNEQNGHSSRFRKRARLSEDGEGSDVKTEKPEINTRTRITTLPRGDDGYIPGSIVRIQLENFLTYDWVEFRPGPYLNMILGPNGTGKSSIACAICLGLNWSPSILGRASELGSFVKIGKAKSYIELELKGAKGTRNLIIRRMLTAGTKSSSFKLNGETATGKDISNRVAQLNVQVGNLCSFLPQDKVSEFAQMNSCQLLRETQRAAGDERLTQWHDVLISAGKELKGLQDLMAGERNQLKTMKDRNAALERDVIRYNDRKRIEHEIALLEILLPVQIYREALEQYVAAKAVRTRWHERVTKLKAKNAPAHALKEKLEKQHKDYSKARDVKKNAAQAKLKKTAAKHKESEKLDTEAEKLTDQMDDLKEKEKETARRIKALKTTISNCEEELARPLEVEDTEKIKAEGRPLRAADINLRTRLEDLRGRQMTNAENSGREQAVINASMQNLQSLDDVNVRKLQNLAEWDRDCHDVILWIRNNRNRFKLEVFEPPVISLNVPDRRFADAIEASFNSNQLRCFVTQCQEDLDTLNHVVNDTTEALGRRGRINTWFRAKSDARLQPPPMTEEEMKALGFDGYAIDYIDCPDRLLWYLKMDVRLHRTAIALDGRRVRVEEAMEAVSRPMANGAAGAVFFAGNIMNQVTRSRYGTKAAQNTTREVRPARNFVGPTVDTEAKRRLDNAIQEARMRCQLLEQEAQKLSEEETALRKEGDDIKAKLAAIKARAEAVTEAQKKRIKAQSKLDNSRRELERKLAEPSVDDQRARLKKEIYDLSLKRIRLAKQYAQLFRETIGDLYEATNVGLQFIQVEANKKALEAMCKEKDEKYELAVMKWSEASQAFQAIKAKSKQALDASRKKIEEVDDELRAEYNQIEEVRVHYDSDLKAAQQNDTAPPDPTGVELRDSEALQVDLEAQRHSLELHLNTNPGVIEQYERRQAEIEALSQKIADGERKATKIEKSIKTAKGSWQPALERLVDSIGRKFSAAFDRIGCAGEIRIREDEDYDKWALDILVKFRDDEKLQILTAQRQSGGERALTTILYLMSLTEEARAPFSLVDEINQGMDARAERNVHNAMVEVTCKPDSAQYFLITPKLLPDLEYHERMKILCVNNGEWLPEENGLGNMMTMINSYLNFKRPVSVAT